MHLFHTYQTLSKNQKKKKTFAGLTSIVSNYKKVLQFVIYIKVDFLAQLFIRICNAGISLMTNVLLIWPD